MTLKGAKPRPELRLWSCERCGRMDQRLNQAGLRHPRGASEIRSVGDRGFERTGTLDTVTSETPNPDI
jgi:hypothetical protein